MHDVILKSGKLTKKLTDMLPVANLLPQIRQALGEREGP